METRETRKVDLSTARDASVWREHSASASALGMHVMLAGEENILFRSVL